MLKVDNGETTVDGSIGTCVNELAHLTEILKRDCLENGMTEDNFNDALDMSRRAQHMALSGMSMDDVEEVLGIPIDRDKSYTAEDEAIVHNSNIS